MEPFLHQAKDTQPPICPTATKTKVFYNIILSYIQHNKNELSPMKVFQLIKRVGGFCHLQSPYSGIGCARRAPVRYLPTLVPKPSFLLRSAPITTATAIYHQSSQPFQEIDSSNAQNTASFSTGVHENFTLDQAMMDGYNEIMTEVFNSFPEGPPNKKVSAEQFLQVQEILLSDKTYSNSPLDMVGDESNPGPGPGPNSDLRRVLNGRKDQFLEATNITEHQFELAMRCIATMGSMCAKGKSVPPMLVAWSKIKDTGMILKPNFLSTFLYVLGLKEEYLDITLEIATFHDLLYGPTENSVYLRINALVTGTMDDPAGAEKVLDGLAVRSILACCCPCGECI